MPTLILQHNGKPVTFFAPYEDALVATLRLWLSRHRKEIGSEGITLAWFGESITLLHRDGAWRIRDWGRRQSTPQRDWAEAKSRFARECRIGIVWPKPAWLFELL